MPHDELTEVGLHTLTVCNACRYCEQYCPVFPAMESRVAFGKGDIAYLANLCHNCGECLYACQYAPPHEFGIDVPRTMARIREQAYHEYCWPAPMAVVFRRNGVLASAVLVLLLAALISLMVLQKGSLPLVAGSGDFYAVVPHDMMIVYFGAAFLFTLLSLSISVTRFWRDIALTGPRSGLGAVVRMVGDVLTLRHMHEDNANCVAAEEVRTPWRRWFHHLTFYGFLLCFASTSVAAIYHVAFGWMAPYRLLSLPVVLGSAGGVGLVLGPLGLLAHRRQRDAALTDPAQRRMDESFIGLLLLTSVTGLALLGFRHHWTMGPLLIVHLAAVLALFVTLPFGKFVHGIYRAAALLNYARESQPAAPRHGPIAPGGTPLAPQAAATARPYTSEQLETISTEPRC